MTRRSIWLPLGVALMLAVAGCESDDDGGAATTAAPSQQPSATTEGGTERADHDRAAIAALVNRMQRAVVAGDGETACSYLSEHGQKTMIELAKDAGLGNPESCEDAVARMSRRIAAAKRRGTPVMGEHFNAAEIQFGGSAKQAQATCRYRGAIQISWTGSHWRIDNPACID